MAQQGTDLVPRTHMATHNHLFQGIKQPLLAAEQITHRWYYTLRQIRLFKNLSVCLHEYMHMHHVHAWCPWKIRRFQTPYNWSNKWLSCPWMLGTKPRFSPRVNPLNLSGISLAL